MTARPVDAALVQAFLAAVWPVGGRSPFACWIKSSSSRLSGRRHWELQRAPARYEARLAQRKEDAVDPDTRCGAAELERRWKAQLTRVAELEQAEAKAEQQARGTLTPEERAALQTRAQALWARWQAETPTPAERKPWLRLAIESVQLDGVSRPGGIEMQIRWRSSVVTRLDVQRVQRGEWSLKPPRRPSRGCTNSPPT